MLKLALTLFSLALLSFAQPAFELRGTVTDAVTNQPLQDAQVDLVPGNGLIGPGIEVTTIQSDSQGAFLFQPTKPGQYVVRTRKDGYTRLSASLSAGTSDQGSAVLSEAKPSAIFAFRLQRAGEISGTVIDDATEKPLANFRIALAVYSSTNGRPFARGATVTTGLDGTFRSASLAAGQYLVQTVPQVTGASHILTKFNEEDIRATDLDYRVAFFPGGPDIESALPVLLTSGGNVNMGTIRVKKQPLNRVLVKLDSASCPQGAEVRGLETAMFAQGSNAYPIGPVPCGPILVTHVSPGTYEVSLSTGQAPDVVTGVVRYTVAGANLELPLRLSQGATLNGTVVAAKDAGELPVTAFKISFAPVSGGVPMAEVQPHDVDAKGRFAFPNVQTGHRRLQVAGLGTDFYLQAVRIGEQPAPGNIFDYSGAGELTVEIGRPPASISGTVMKNDKPVAAADVVFMRWPAEPLDDREAIRHIVAGADGKFQVTGIVPGEYRLFSVAGTDREAAEQPAAWQRLSARAEKLKLERGASQNLTLQISDPSR
jgi:hypothetical protein